MVPLPEAEQLLLKAVRTHCPEIDALTRHVRSFAVMLTERQGERLPDRLAAVRQDDLPTSTPSPRASTECPGASGRWRHVPDTAQGASEPQCHRLVAVVVCEAVADRRLDPGRR